MANAGWQRIGALLGASGLVLGCASDRDDRTTPSGVEAATSPVYALQATVFNPDDTATSYVVLTNTLDIDELALEGAREFPGRVVITAAGGKLFVGSEGEPKVTRYSITDALEWVDDADDALSLGNLGTPYITFDTLVNESTAYARLDELGVGRVVWDPKGLQIVGTREQTKVPLELGGVPLTWGSGPGFSFGGPPFWTFSYADADYFDRGTSTIVTVYDPRTQEEQRVFELDCPSTTTPSRDEEGNIYLSNWDHFPTRALYHLGPPSCVRRLKPDATLDADWKPDFTTWTGGRHIMAWYYLENGKAIGNVLHHEELEALGANFDGDYDPDVYDEIESGEHYRPWLFDLDTETARPVEGLSNILSAMQLVKLDDRAFVLLPHDDWTRMDVYEIDAKRGSATKRFGVDAYIDGWVRVR